MDLDSEATVSDKVTQATPLTQANNLLAMNLLKMFSEDEKNVLFSPCGVSSALAMLYFGATGNTLQEMEAVLGYDKDNLSKNSTLDFFRLLMLNFDDNSDYYALTLSNCLFIEKNCKIKSEYKSVLEDSFDALMLEVEFAEDSTKITQEINGWVCARTDKMIPEVVKSLLPTSSLAVLNSLCFRGNWIHPFSEQSTYLQCFCNKDESDNVKEVEMMHLNEFFLYHDAETFKALELPFMGEDIVMYLLLPYSRDGLNDLLNSLSPTFVQDLKKKMQLSKVEVELPKFRIESNISYRDLLQKLGLSRLFQTGAELEAISSSTQLDVTECLQKVVLEVNEEGCVVTSAAVVTACIGCPPSTTKFTVDHPFIFAVIDTRNDMILFLGKMEDLF